MKREITVVIPNWNGKDMLKACLGSLRAQTLKPQVIVVDNGSTDGSVEFISQKYPEVEVIARDKNYGFTGGVIPGMEAAVARQAKYVALLNNDAQAEQNWLKRLVDTLDKHPKVGIVTSKIVDMKNGRLDTTGEIYSVFGTPFPRGRGKVDTGQYDDQPEIFAATGGATLYRVRMLKQIGLIDNRYFAYYEDVDISFRARLAGWQVRYQPQATVRHLTNATSSRLGDKTLFWLYRNAVYLYLKTMPGWLFWKYLPAFLIGFGGRTVSLLTKGKFQLMVHAWWDIAISLPGLLVDRYRIQHQRVVSLPTVAGWLYHRPSPAQAAQWPLRWFYKSHSRS